MQPRKRIFLIGFMGSGKTTVGRKLSSYLKWSYIDLDERVEQMAGMKIPRIFSEKGELWFRQSESEALQGLLKETDTVISAGGGAPCFGDNMNRMLESGLTIYLKMTPLQLRNRLVHSSKERPLLKNLEFSDLEGFIRNKLAERESWYLKAEITFNRFDADLSDLFLLVRKYI